MRELEEKCRTQSEQFSLLSRDLEQFRQHAGKIDLLGSSPVASLDVPSSPSKSFPRFMNGLAPSIGKGKCLPLFLPTSLPPASAVMEKKVQPASWEQLGTARGV